MMQMSFQKQIPWVVAFLVAVSLGLYFRTYSLHHDHAPRADKLLASLVVEKNIVEQFQKELDSKAPQLSADDKLKLAREQARRAIQIDRSQYDRSVADALRKLNPVLPKTSNRRYLLEADPYYYFYLTEQIIQKGSIASETKGGQYFHPLMHAPDGYWTAITWHPYVGYGLGRMIHFFVPNMEWMETLCWVPLILTVLACIAFLFLARAMEMHSFSFLIGAMALMLSPIFMQRSGYGWYDTDPYNYIFPFTILALLIFGLKEPKATRQCAIASGFLTGLYGLFWTGWPFLFLLLPSAVAVSFLTLRYVLKLRSKATYVFRDYFFVHVISSVCFAALFLTPKGLFDSIKGGWDILSQFSLEGKDVWPNIFLTVGEARGVSLKKLIFLSGNYVTFSVAVFGLLVAFYQAWKSANAQKIGRWIVLFLFTLPLSILPLKTERFGILFVIPLSIWTMFGAREIYEQIQLRLSSVRFFSSYKKSIKLICTGIMLLIFLPLPLITAHLVSTGMKPIMDDAWYDTMQELRQKTPEKSIVNSWWPPGYFISSLAHRRVIADGGTQHFQETYWLAKILASQDEREAAGLMRMLNTSGNRALLFLKAFGIDVADAVDLIMSVVSLSRAEAETHLPAEMPEPLKKQFLDFTHGTLAAPSYVLVYSDMIDQNLAVTMVSRWNFRKAREMQNKRSRGRSGKYVQDFINMTDGVLKYSPMVASKERNGNVLTFPNGLLVNLDLMDAVLSLPEKRIQGRPASLFYMKEGRLEEKTFQGERIDTSALLIEREGTFYAVLADARLIRSLMFRLYYLKGEGLTLFKPFSWKRNELNGDQVGVFELNESALLEVKSQAMSV